MSEFRKKMIDRWMELEGDAAYKFMGEVIHDLCDLREALDKIWDTSPSETTSAYRMALISEEALSASDKRLKGLGWMYEGH